MYFECLYQIFFDIFEYSWTIHSKSSLFEMFVVFIFPIELTNSVMKYFFSLLFFDNSMIFILNKLFYNRDIDNKGSGVRGFRSSGIII